MSRLRPSPALAVAFVALLVSVGGTGYAAIKLPANSVGAKQLKKGAVVRAKIQAGAVDATKLAPNSIGGASINENALAKVPSAAQADHATTAGALDRITYKSAIGSTPAAPSSTAGSIGTLDIVCDPGQHPVGAGLRLADEANQIILDVQLSSTGYEFRAVNFDTGGAHAFTGTVACVAASAVG